MRNYQRLKYFIGVIISCVMLLFSSCSGNVGKDKLSELLYSDYTADISFSMSENGETLEGTATVSRSDSVQISFSSPELFSGLSVESGEDGGSGNIYFTYYGMRLPLPDNSLGKVNMLLSLFSGETAGAAASVPARDIVQYPEFSEGNPDIPETVKPVKCAFPFYGENTQCTLVYDSVSGYPLYCEMLDGTVSVSVRFDKIKPKT